MESRVAEVAMVAQDFAELGIDLTTSGCRTLLLLLTHRAGDRDAPPQAHVPRRRRGDWLAPRAQRLPLPMALPVWEGGHGPGCRGRQRVDGIGLIIIVALLLFDIFTRQEIGFWYPGNWKKSWTLPALQIPLFL